MVTAPSAQEVTATASSLADGGQRPVDAIVYATGFEVVELAAHLEVTGPRRTDLREEWADENPKAYLGPTVPGFPNFFCLYGPNHSPGHGGSIIFLAECQSRYISGCIVGDGRARHRSAMEARPEARDEWVRRGRRGTPRTDLDASGHEHLLSQQAGPRVLCDAVALRRLLGDDARSGPGRVPADQGASVRDRSVGVRRLALLTSRDIAGARRRSLLSPAIVSRDRRSGPCR